MSKNLFEEMCEQLISTREEVFEGELSHLDGLIKMRESKKQLEKGLEIIKDFENEFLDQITTGASEYPKGYKGFIITQTQGRKMFNFKGIPEIEKVEEETKKTKQKYESAFNGFQKGIVQTAKVEEKLYWIDENGELLPFPEISFGKSFLTIRETKK